MSKQVMQRALSALEDAGTLTTYDWHPASIFKRFYASATGDYVDLRQLREKTAPAIEALRAEIAKPVEPVGHFYFDRDDFTYKQAKDKISFPACIKLYTTPPDTEAMRRDAERLQHLCNSVRCASANIDGKHGWNFLHGHGWTTGATFREAIDAAIAAQGGGE